MKPATEKAAGERWWIHAQNALTLVCLIVAPYVRERSFHPIQEIAGTLVFVLGGTIGILGLRDLGSNRTPHPLPRSESVLIKSGIYSKIRHPLYASLILVTFGWSIFWSSPLALLCSLALAVLLDRKARLEEHFLTKRFPEYSAYARRVRRFIPGIY